MQKRPAAKLRGRSCSICFIGMRFLLRGDQKERGKCTVKFSEMPYARPDAGRAAEQYRELAARAKNAESGEALAELFRQAGYPQVVIGG